MSAVAGPGPSTMASTSMVPTSARMKVKKRVVNLVNPADPQEFSAQSISPSTSPNQSMEAEEDSRDEERITPPTMRFSETTQTFNFTPGVKGILRSTGTPGSGNGVRFFPKNKFRIITPNASVHQPTPKPPPSPTNSFFSQLLAVTIPSMSPRRGSNSENGKNVGDESWEVPGQEGEISLIASSIGSGGDRSTEFPNPIHRYDEQVDEREIEESIDVSIDEREREDSWNGQPTIHCSPLSLPEGNTSREISFIMELPSTELNFPDDMSNLLSTNFNPDEGSFSINDPPSTLAPTRELQVLSPIKEDISVGTEDEFWNLPPPPTDMSMESEKEIEELSNPTIRRPLSTTAQNIQPISPTPIGRPFTSSSIFADMSAEQADLTWPLTRRTDDDELDSNYPTPTKSCSPTKLQTPKAGAVGDITQFYDTTMTMSFSSPTSPSGLILRTSPQTKDLIIPTKNLFEAQVAHTTALTTELELYKELSKKLQSEVVERDECLVRLQIRALDAEVLHTQVQDLQREINSLKSSRKSLSPSPSSSPCPTLRAGSKIDGMSDRTLAAQSEAKELEIRLAKTLADSEDLSRQLHDVQVEKQKVESELRKIRDDQEKLEDEEKDRLIKDQAHLEQIELLNRELELAHRQIEEFESMDQHNEEVHKLQQELDEAHHQISELEAQEDEVHALKAELDSAHQQLDQHESKACDTESVQKELEETHQRLEQAEQDLQEANRQLAQMQDKDDEISALRNELQSAHDQLDDLESQQSDNALAQQEIDKANEKISELKIHVKELTENKLVDEDEIERLINKVDQYKSYKKSEEEMRKRLIEVESRLEIERNMREDIEKRWKEEEENVNALEAENDELRESLKQTERRLSEVKSNSPRNDTSSSALKDEIMKLRSESASKDLEILNLQRRKVELKEDREMLNIALDSKQQELELMKRKFAVKGIAGSTPLGTSRKTNLETSTMETLSTPLPGKGSISSIQTQTRRRSSLALQTPLPNVPKHNPSFGLQTPLPGNTRHGVQLHPSTRITSRVMRKVEEEENKPPISGSIGRRRERMLV